MTLVRSGVVSPFVHTKPALNQNWKNVVSDIANDINSCVVADIFEELCLRGVLNSRTLRFSEMIGLVSGSLLDDPELAGLASAAKERSDNDSFKMNMSMMISLTFPYSSRDEIGFKEGMLVYVNRHLSKETIHQLHSEGMAYENRGLVLEWDMRLDGQRYEIFDKTRGQFMKDGILSTPCLDADLVVSFICCPSNSARRQEFLLETVFFRNEYLTRSLVVEVVSKILKFGYSGSMKMLVDLLHLFDSFDERAEAISFAIQGCSEEEKELFLDITRSRHGWNEYASNLLPDVDLESVSSSFVEVLVREYLLDESLADAFRVRMDSLYSS